MKIPRQVLALGAHTDDIELGCGATLSRLRRAGSDICVQVFSRAEASLPPGLAPDVLEHEFRAAMSHLGLSGNDVRVARYPVRRLNESRQDILEHLVRLEREIRPDLVLTMNSKDTHQDHQVIYSESLRAFRRSTLWGYETAWNQQESRFDVFVEVYPEDVECKVRMLSEYASQRALGRTYVAPDYIRAAALVHGVQGRMPLAEVYELNMLRWDVE